MEIAAGQPPPPDDIASVEAGGRDVFADGRTVPWTLRDVGVGLAWFVAAFILIPAAVLTPLLVAYDQDSDQVLTASIVASVAVYLAIAAIAGWRTFGRHGGGLGTLGLKAPAGSTYGWAAAAIGGAIGVSLAYGGIIEAFDIGWLQQECDDQVPQEIRDSAWLLAMSGVLAIGFAPITEEAFFRGFVFPGIARAWGVAAGVAVSGLLFGSAHLLGNPLLYKSVPLFTMIGAVFALAYWRSGNLLSVVLAHLVFNTIGVISITFTTCPE
jgi:membrane protease YdiL (CAAX protease family)